MTLFNPPTTVSPVLVAQYELYRRRFSRREVVKSPASLAMAGNADLLWGFHIRCAVVGSRRASAEGLARAGSVAKACAAAGHVVVSGLAAGIDGAAHRAALTESGATIAVIPTTLEAAPVPSAHAAMQAEIAERGLVVSQFTTPPQPMAKGFIARNTTIALVSCVVFVPEAGERSGSRHVVREALGFGRDVFIHEAVRESLRGVRWLEQAIEAGAETYADADVAEIVATLEGASPMLP